MYFYKNDLNVTRFGAVFSDTICKELGIVMFLYDQQEK